MGSIGGSLNSSSIKIFLSFLIATLLLSEWNNVVSSQAKPKYVKGGIDTRTCRSDAICKLICKDLDEGDLGGKCRRVGMFTLQKKCFCAKPEDVKSGHGKLPKYVRGRTYKRTCRSDNVCNLICRDEGKLGGKCRRGGLFSVTKKCYCKISE